MHSLIEMKERKRIQDFGINSVRGRLFDRIINKDAIVATPLRIDVSIQE